MSETQPRDFSTSSPPPIDEGYWSALLSDGEWSGAVGPDLYAERGNGDLLELEREAIFSDPASDWAEVFSVMEADETVELPVVGYNRGGLLVQWNGLRGFVPASQLVDFPLTAGGFARREELARRVGERLRLRVIEVDQAQNRLILSERAAQVNPGTRASVLAKLEPGMVCTGKVTNLCNFGAFVDLGGVEGLIHISELSWGRVGHPADLLKRGQEVRVYVMDVDREQGRVALSLKRLKPDPWESVESKYHVGQIVEGVITNVVDFGAFACIEEGLEGLIHVSELAEGNFLHPRNVVREGDRVRARILNIDSRARRLGLSLRRL